MEKQILKPANSIIHGVQGIIQVGVNTDPLLQEYLFIEDRDDRGLGTFVCKCGLPGGGIENETPKEAIIRELDEEVAIYFKDSSLKQVGCFQKKRSNGNINDNYLFFARLNYRPDCKTNDPKEVSKVHIFSLGHIINLSTKNAVHEGSIRLLFHFLNGKTFGSLNEPAYWCGYEF
jgi:ADP-ribose pyrophosphatase YjhB (NUDIX family)